MEILLQSQKDNYVWRSSDNNFLVADLVPAFSYDTWNWLGDKKGAFLHTYPRVDGGGKLGIGLTLVLTSPVEEFGSGGAATALVIAQLAAGFDLMKSGAYTLIYGKPQATLLDQLLVDKLGLSPKMAGLAEMGISLGLPTLTSSLKSATNAVNGGSTLVSGQDYVQVYRGTRIIAEREIFKETGYILSDSARALYAEARYAGMPISKSLDIALSDTKLAHAEWIKLWGSEELYAQAHAAFGTEISGAFALDRTLVSVTTNYSVAKNFAGSGQVFGALVPKIQLIRQALQGAG